jgi:hypothetical protein
VKRTWVISIIVLALVIIGIVSYLARPYPDETENALRHESSPPGQPAVESSSTPSALVSCAGPTSSQIPIAGLVSRHQWAHSLVMANHFDQALTELRNIATLDPGYPAINLEISDALLKSKHANEAKDAINLQLEISGCLANLPERDMQDYCKAEWVSEPRGGCVPELARINQQAHYEAGRVDAEMTRISEPHPAPTPSAATVALQRTRVAPPPKVSPAAVTASVGPEIAPVKPSADPAAVPAPLPPINIKTTEASDHVGQLAKVCGTVVSKHTADESNGKPTFVNLDHPFPNQSFTVVYWGNEAEAVGEFPATGNVCVTGTVAMYRGTPQIVVHDAKGWSQSGEK